MTTEDSNTHQSEGTKSETGSIKSQDDDMDTEVLYQMFKEQKAVFTHEVMLEVEQNFAGEARGATRRSGLALLTQDCNRLLKMASDDEDAAKAFAELHITVGEYAKHLHQFAEMMEAASARALMSLSDRSDVDKVMETAKTQISNN